MRPRLDDSFFERSRAAGWLHALWPALALVVACALAAHADDLASGALLFAAIGLLQYRVYFPLHECAHYTLLPTRRENRVAGQLLAALIATPFEGFRREHWIHHRHYGSRRDPGSVDYLVRFASRGQLLRFLLLPLVGGTLVAKLVDNWAPLLRGEGAGRPVPAPRARGSAAWTAPAVILLVQALLACLAAQGVAAWWRYPVFVLLPGATLFLFLSRLRMFLEHSVLDYAGADPLAPARPVVRSVESEGAASRLLSGLGFQYHAEHHLQPAVPGRQLARLHAQCGRAWLDADQIEASYPQIFRKLWAQLGTGEAACERSSWRA